MKEINGFWKTEKKIIIFILKNLVLLSFIGTFCVMVVRIAAQPIIIAELRHNFDTMHLAAQKDSLSLACKRIDSVEKAQRETLEQLKTVDGKLDVILRVLVKQ